MASHHWNLRQVDVYNVFLNQYLQEEIFIKQPIGYVDPMFPNHVCKFNRALYGLKQVSHAWYQHLVDFLIKCGFKNSRTDPSLFSIISSRFTLYVLVYVDSLIVTSNKDSEIGNFITLICQEFNCRDLRALKFFLGMEVTLQKYGDILVAWVLE